MPYQRSGRYRRFLDKLAAYLLPGLVFAKTLRLFEDRQTPLARTHFDSWDVDK